MFLKMEDLRQFNQVHEIAGGIGVGTARTPRRRPTAQQRMARRRSVVSGLGIANPAERIRALTDPERAKVMIDKTIKLVQFDNAAKAQKISSYIMQRASTKPGMGYLSYSAWNPAHRWPIGRGVPLSDLEKYTEAERQLIYKYLRNSDPAVIEYNFNQANLDGALANAKAGEALPATVPTLKDPVQVAVDTFKQGVKDDLVGAGAAVVDAGVASAKAVGAGIKNMYEAAEKAVGLPFEWLNKIKWYAIGGVVVVGAFVAWPYIKAARAPAQLFQKSLEKRLA